MSPPPDLADRVAEFIAEHELLEPEQPLLTLVSGGADSLCLWGVLRALGHPVEALHVEHGLRGSRGLDDAAYCAALGASVVPVDLEPGGNLEARDDETNANPAFRRNLIRHEVMPALLRVHPGAELNLARSAELLAELDDLVSELAGDHVSDVIDLDQVAELPRALRVLVLREAAERAAGRPLRLPRQLTGRLEQLAERRGGVERLSLAADLEAVRDRTHLSFTAPSL
jgi:tRNA(Ile)-lysidine synthase TilS/MesJ